MSLSKWLPRKLLSNESGFDTKENRLLFSKINVDLDNELCSRIECMSSGVCAIRPNLYDSSKSQAKCLCRIGTQGEFCEQQGKLHDNKLIENIEIVK